MKRSALNDICLWNRMWLRNVLLVALFVTIFGRRPLHLEFEDVAQRMLPSVNIRTQTKAALDVIYRIAPNFKKKFAVIVDPKIRRDGKDAFRLQTDVKADILKITASSGVAATWGFHHYLKYYCNSHISWETSNVNVPTSLPNVNISVTANDWIRYYQNVCTTSYSFVWWNWTQWEKHTDWIALNGMNLVLTFNGQEAIWERVYKRLTLTQQEIDEHFAGPAFLSWSRMGNMRGFGGPLSENWHYRSRALQKMILTKLRNLGIKTVLPAFAGHVPRAFKRIYPSAQMTKLASWNGFNDTYCCPYILDPRSSLFKKVGKIFLEEQTEEFGTDHFYNCDTYNEMTPISSNLTYLSDLGKSIYDSMTEVDVKAIWVLQGWLFYNEQTFWKENETSSFLTSVPLGRMLILDLQSEQFPQFGRLHSYFGQPFVWCMLHNFGGTLGLFGSLDVLNEQVFQSRTFVNSTMVGTGLTPEGINQNYVVYDFMLEMGWRKKPTDVDDWISKYIFRRYGKFDGNATMAWKVLRNTVYNYKGIMRMRGKYAMTRRPSLNIKTWIWYDFRNMIQALKYLIEADLRDNAGYLHDLVDVTRQVCQVVGDQLYNLIVKSYHAKTKNIFEEATVRYLGLFDVMDQALMTNEAFLLGNWLNSAKSIALNEEEKEQYEYNARNQITLWGPDGQIIDYANKQWAGVVSHYFKPRWSKFLSALNDSLINGTTFNQEKVQSEIFYDIEEPFTFDKSNFTDVPSGDIVKIAKQLVSSVNAQKILVEELIEEVILNLKAMKQFQRRREGKNGLNHKKPINNPERQAEKQIQP